MATQEFRRVIAIGDIHGCAHALDVIVEQIKFTQDDLLVCLGDFVDQGRNTKEVIDTLIALQKECQLVTLSGNHEEMLLSALETEQAKDSWLMFGGIATINSYKFGGDIDAIPAQHVEFIRQSVDFFETDDHIFVHANYVEDQAPEEWADYVRRWSLLEDPIPAPHQSGKTVYVGHTEQRNGEILDLGHVVCLDTACCNYGWLTAIDVLSGKTWQASKFGQLRESDHEPRMPKLQAVSPVVV